MLAIRMQRTGRKGHAMFRVVVQDSRRTPTSGKVVAQLGSYDPHAKTLVLDKEKASFYLDHGAQPSDRAARLLETEGIKLPSWVSLSADRQRTTRNAAKRRSTRPVEEVATVVEEAVAEPAVEESAVETAEPEVAAEPVDPDTAADAPAEPSEEPAAEVEPEASEPAETEVASEEPVPETAADEASPEPSTE